MLSVMETVTSVCPAWPVEGVMVMFSGASEYQSASEVTTIVWGAAETPSKVRLEALASTAFAETGSSSSLHETVTQHAAKAIANENILSFI